MPRCPTRASGSSVRKPSTIARPARSTGTTEISPRTRRTGAASSGVSIVSSRVGRSRVASIATMADASWSARRNVPWGVVRSRSTARRSARTGWSTTVTPGGIAALRGGPRGGGRSAAVPIPRRELNRALLERQHLLRRVRRTPLEGVEDLVGLQAQATLPPYLGLWARVEGFDPDQLGRLLVDREAVRLTLMRGTVHLVSVADALWLRPLVQVVAERGHGAAFGRRMAGAEPAAIAAAAREVLAGEALTARELGRLLVERGIGDDVEAMGYATRVHAPLVQVPPRGVWGKGGQARYATLEAWTGRALEPEPSPERLVLRYLAAFGPATVMDAQSWSGLTRLRDAFERLRPRPGGPEGEGRRHALR